MTPAADPPLGPVLIDHALRRGETQIDCPNIPIQLRGIHQSLFAGGCVGISSTMLVAKTFAEQRLKDKFTDLVFGVLVFEDLAAIFLLAVLTAVASGANVSPGAFVGVAARWAATIRR